MTKIAIIHIQNGTEITGPGYLKLDTEGKTSATLGLKKIKELIM
jgi:hypothetical protein